MEQDYQKQLIIQNKQVCSIYIICKVMYKQKNYKGFLRIVVEEVQNGNGRISTGKVPLSFKIYCKLCKCIFQKNSPSGRFALLLHVLSWNLAYQSSNTKTIHFHHMSWIHNSLQIYFAHMKDDQTGDFPQDTRHRYTNPYNPAICPVLTLISCLLVTSPTSDTTLFPGANQNNWYNKYLNNLLQKRQYSLRNYSINIDHIRAYLVMKGASIYMTRGYVGGPMQ